GSSALNSRPSEPCNRDLQPSSRRRKATLTSALPPRPTWCCISAPKRNRRRPCCYAAGCAIFCRETDRSGALGSGALGSGPRGFGAQRPDALFGRLAPAPHRAGIEAEQVEDTTQGLV